jgi:hypothetical protein
MGPTTPEQPPKKSMQEQARAAAEQIVADMRANHQNEMARINQIQDEGERIRARASLEQQEVEKIRSKMSEQIRDVADSGRTDSPEDKKIKAEKAKHIFLEAKALGDEGVKVGNAQSQQAFNKIVEYMKNGQITDEGALVLERNIGNDLIKGIVFSKQGEPPSSFEKNLRISYEVDPIATAPLLRDLGENQGIYGYEGTPQDLLAKIGKSMPENNKNLQAENQGNSSEAKTLAEFEKSSFDHDLGNYYLSRFTKEQLELISTFYSPEAFVDYMEHMSNGDEKGDGKNFLTPKDVQKEKKDIEHHIKEYYEKNNKTLTESELKYQVEKHWGEEISEKMYGKISDMVNQLFLELQQKPTHKFFDQIMQEDPFQGPSMIKNKIQAAINSLMTKVDQIERGKGSDPNLAERIKKLNLYRHAAKKTLVEERANKDEKDLNKKLYPGLKPIPYGENIGLGQFIEQINLTVDHTISKTEYFHNSRAIYGHPPGKEGFYHQLGEFAEQLKGTEIDEIMLLPDGQYIMEANHLYEKMLQEDFAQMDQKHRPDQLTNKLERVNSGIELEVIEMFEKYYPELTRQRVKNIVNSAVGISRGVFLTESEMSAYADPVDSEGKGMIASYSTNDDGSLNVFNPLHTVLRWQGEQFWNSMYFMPVNGQPGKMWDHNKAWNNMAKYMDSFLVGKGRGKGKDALPETFADAMMDIGNVGGPGKRKNWRMKYSLDGHFIRDPDGTINAPETFKAMEAIGYEAVFNFVQNDQAGPDLLKATEKTDPGQVKERKELFKYIYKRYFHEGDESSFQESELDNYLAKLQIRGEEKALKLIKGEVKGRTAEKGTLSAGSWEKQVAYETSQLFMQNMLTHYVAARMPTKLLRIDKNRLHDDGISHWEKIRREFSDWKREDFDKSMKDLTMAEMLLSKQISGKIRKEISFDENWTLNKIDKITDLSHRLNEDKIRELLSKNNKGETFKSEEEINNAIKVFRKIRESFNKEKDGVKFLDGEGTQRRKDFTFTFGLEDTDYSLMAFRGTGPRMVARAIKDVAIIEKSVTPWMIQMPQVLNEIAINGKHDFSPIIEYMRKAQLAVNEVNGVEATYDLMYKMAGTVINYFKKDGMAKPLFGLLRLGKMNSIAAKYAGRSTAVWEWDSRDIDRFAVALESYSLLKNKPYDLQKFEDGKFIGGQLEDRWIKIPGIKKPIKFGKKRHVDYEYNALRLRKEHGADWKAITWDYINQLLPLAMAFLLWKYIKDAMDEASGKKKQ